ncbi:MAG: tRNA glutamyl-Q(34) synthetase GluQRS [Woeseiaceae bacterium]|nr:tRNA glutamyl-Q(34) synthetase GluQRS [Woeseiaceae bacterium]
MADSAPYIGRFAPSPTGPLHFGSLLAAVASYLEARSNNGRWLLRIEDIDPPRQQRGADKRIIEALEACGFEWHGPVTYQSEFRQRHDEIVKRLLAEGLAYPCSCSRSDLADARRGPLGRIYPGTCRNGATAGEVTIRLRTDNHPLEFTDALQGRFEHRLESESGDFVIKRRDGLIAYHLAVVVDDHDQGVTDIVRGIDLLDSTPRQIFLQRQLGFATPGYLHIPVVANAAGQKLSKQTGAAAIDPAQRRQLLVQALDALGQDPPAELADTSLESIWQWAGEHWQPRVMAGRKTIAAAKYTMAEKENPLS